MLSVVAQQIMAIMEAIKARKTEFVFMDRMVKCNWQCGIFITVRRKSLWVLIRASSTAFIPHRR